MSTQTIHTATNPNAMRRALAALVGKRAEHRTSEGETLVGTIEAHDAWNLRVRFNDGRWARLDDTITVID